jgi:hypothetical protein
VRFSYLTAEGVKKVKAVDGEPRGAGAIRVLSALRGHFTHALIAIAAVIAFAFGVPGMNKPVAHYGRTSPGSAFGSGNRCTWPEGSVLALNRTSFDSQSGQYQSRK